MGEEHAGNNLTHSFVPIATIPNIDADLEHTIRIRGMQQLAESNVLAVYLDTKDDLVGAIKLYDRLGYERCARYNDNPQATIFMRKRLP